MRNILFASQDPGGTNALIPIINNIDKYYNPIVIAKGTAVDIYNRRDVSCKDVTELLKDVNVDSLTKIINDYSIDLVITGTCVTDFYERHLWIAARKAGVKSLAVLDSWCNYGLRFSDLTFKDCDKYVLGSKPAFLPDKIFVMDEYAKKQMSIEGIDSRIIEVIGQPFLSSLKELYNEISQNEINSYKKKLFGDSKKKCIVFASDNLSNSFEPSALEYWGYDEHSAFIDFYESFIESDYKDKYNIIIRPHPKETPGTWDKILHGIPDKDVSIILDGDTKEELVLVSSDVVVGMWSMLLVEAVLADKKVLSIQVGSKRKASFVLSDQSLLEPVYNRCELKSVLNKYLDDNENFGKIHWNIDENSLHQAIAKIKLIID